MLKVCTIALLCLLVSVTAMHDEYMTGAEEEIATDDPRVLLIITALSNQLTEGYAVSSVVKATHQVCLSHFITIVKVVIIDTFK